MTNTLLFLGTGAGDWPRTVPPETKPYNHNFRCFSAALVNDDLLIDFGPSLLWAIEAYDVNIGKITDILLTHSHWDHLNGDVLTELARRWGNEPRRLWGHPDALKFVPLLPQIEQHPVDFGMTLEICGWQVEPVWANHWVDESKEQPLNYLFTVDDVQWFYGTDTSWIRTPTWRRLSKARLDLVVLDATYGDELDPQGQFGHNTLTMIRLIIDTMRKDDLLKANAQVLLTHLACGYHPPHDELQAHLNPEGIVAAYDGMKVDID